MGFGAAVAYWLERRIRDRNEDYGDYGNEDYGVDSLGRARSHDSDRPFQGRCKPIFGVTPRHT